MKNEKDIAAAGGVGHFQLQTNTNSEDAFASEDEFPSEDDFRRRIPEDEFPRIPLRRRIPKTNSHIGKRPLAEGAISVDLHGIFGPFEQSPDSSLVTWADGRTGW